MKIIIGTVYISFVNALVELYVAIRSIMTGIWWLMGCCSMEYTVEDEDGTIIHHFPQLTDFDDNDF